MCEAPGSVVTLLCSGIQLYSAERRIADCILADVKRASMCTSAELARLSCSSEATVTRLCHKLGFENYRKFQLALARDAMEQQEAQRMRDEGQDELHQALLNILANREEELRATIQAIDTRQLRQILSLLRSCEVMEVVSEGGGLPVAFDASIRFSHLGKRCVSSAVHEKNLAFAQTLTPKDILTCDSHGPLAQLADYVMTASNREQRLIEGSHAASLLSPNVLIEVLYYLLRMENL
jgi:RpiR family carbohydrate utilization transcriptional regulator